MHLVKTDLPDPEAPIITNDSPKLTLKFIWSRITVSSKDFFNSLTSILGYFITIQAMKKKITQ